MTNVTQCGLQALHKGAGRHDMTMQWRLNTQRVHIDVPINVAIGAHLRR